MSDHPKPVPFALPAEFDDIDDALADGLIDEARADALREQVVREYRPDHDSPAEPDGTPYTDHAWASEYLSRNPDGDDAAMIRAAIEIIRNPRDMPSPYMTQREFVAAIDAERKRAEARRREALTVQLSMFDEELGEAPGAYDEPAQHPDFERFAILLSEFAVWMGRWPREADVAEPPEGLTLPSFEEMSTCGGFRRVLDAAMIERPVEVIA